MVRSLTSKPDDSGSVQVRRVAEDLVRLERGEPARDGGAGTGLLVAGARRMARPSRRACRLLPAPFNWLADSPRAAPLAVEPNVVLVLPARRTSARKPTTIGPIRRRPRPW